MYTTCCELVIFMYWTRNLMIHRMWVIWCQNTCFWKRLTCTFNFIPTYTNSRSYTFISFLENFPSILFNLLTFETLACVLFKKFEKEKKTHSWVFVWSQKTIIRKNKTTYSSTVQIGHTFIVSNWKIRQISDWQG